jgi:hypothetical protein
MPETKCPETEKCRKAIIQGIDLAKLNTRVGCITEALAFTKKCKGHTCTMVIKLKDIYKEK